MHTTITMRSGERHGARGYARAIAEEIGKAVEAKSILLQLEKDTVPSGQMFFINPNEVESVKDET